MTDVDAVIDRLRALNPVIGERWGAEIVGLFGSVARGEDSPDSDLDLLVTYHRPIGLAVVDLADFLETECGRRVDLASSKWLRPWFREAIADEVRDV